MKEKLLSESTKKVMRKRKEKVYSVYRLEFPSGKYYIGVTSEKVHRRIKKHKTSARRAKVKNKVKDMIHKALNKYGDDFKVKILKETSSKQIAYNAEIFFIKKYNSRVPSGYNLTDGGDGVFGNRMTEKKKKAGRKVYERYLKPYVDKSKVKLKCSNGKTYSSINEAARELDLDSVCIGRILRGKQNQTQGYTFTPLNKTYKQVKKNKDPRKYDNNSKPVIRSDGVRFKNIKSAARQLKVTAPAVRNVLKGRKKHVKGFTFEFCDDSELVNKK